MVFNGVEVWKSIWLDWNNASWMIVYFGEIYWGSCSPEPIYLFQLNCKFLESSLPSIHVTERLVKIFSQNHFSTFPIFYSHISWATFYPFHPKCVKLFIRFHSLCLFSSNILHIQALNVFFKCFSFKYWLMRLKEKKDFD